MDHNNIWWYGWKKQRSYLEKKWLCDRKEGDTRQERRKMKGWESKIDFLHKNIRVCVSVQIKDPPSQVSLTNTVQKKVSILFSPGWPLILPQGLEPEMLSFLFHISEPFSPQIYSMILESMHIFSMHSLTPAIQLHGNAKNHCLLFKSLICFSHLVLLVLLLENPALSQYLFFLLSFICLKNISGAQASTEIPTLPLWFPFIMKIKHYLPPPTFSVLNN